MSRGALRVRLEAKAGGAALSVIATQLSRGDDLLSEQTRLAEVTSRTPCHAQPSQPACLIHHLLLKIANWVL